MRSQTLQRRRSHPFAVSPSPPCPAAGAAEGDRAGVTQLPALLRGGTEPPRWPGWGQEQGGDRSRLFPSPSSSRRGQSPHSHAAREASRGTLSEPGHRAAQGHPGDTQPVPPGRRTHPAPFQEVLPAQLTSASKLPHHLPSPQLAQGDIVPCPSSHPEHTKPLPLLGEHPRCPTATWRVHQGPQCRGRAGVSAGDTGSRRGEAGRAGAPKPTG